MFSIETTPDGTVRMVGRLDASRTAAAEAVFDRTSGAVTVDCSTLDYLSSAGLGVLLKTQKRLLATGGGLRLTGVSPGLREIFGYSGFDRIFRIEAAP